MKAGVESNVDPYLVVIIAFLVIVLQSVRKC